MISSGWRRVLMVVAIPAAVAVSLTACTPSRHHLGGGLAVTVTGHAEDVGGPMGAPNVPAAGVAMKILAGTAVMSTGTTDEHGDFRWALRDGSYTLVPDPSTGCPKTEFTVPTKSALSLICQRR